MSRLSEMPGTPRSSIFRRETGEGVPRLNYLIRMSEIYNVTLDELLGVDGHPRVQIALI